MPDGQRDGSRNSLDACVEYALYSRSADIAMEMLSQNACPASLSLGDQITYLFICKPDKSHLFLQISNSALSQRQSFDI